MHQPIRDHLEKYLSDSTDLTIPQEFHAHVAACRSCAEHVHQFMNHSQALRNPLPAGEPELQPGFYARVMDRIERRPQSIWSVFQEPVFGRRLAYACTALVLVLGTYLVSSEPGDSNPGPTVVVSQDRPSPNGDETVQPKDRDAVLVSLASFHE